MDRTYSLESSKESSFYGSQSGVGSTYSLYEADFKTTSEWNQAIAKFDIKHFYHHGEWLDFIEQTQSVRRRIYAIHAGTTILGYLPGFVLKRGPVRIFGSPLPGWTTDYMGPVLQRGVEMEGLLTAIMSALRRDHIHHAELCHNSLDWKPRDGVGYEQAFRTTYIAPIPYDEDVMLSTFSKSTRKAIRRALEAGITVKSSEDEAFIDIYYDQLREVFEKSGSEPTYPKERVRALWKNIMPTGRMLNTMVMKGSHCIATRIDFFGEGCLHSFGSASYRDYLKDYPNEIARYHAMTEAMKRGLTKYDMSGDGTYKAKFNAERVKVPVIISSTPLLMALRQAVKALHRCQARLKYLVNR
jgi:CelD/BcsL family acetyltransferase involved in cellulose biosynthesis